MNWDNYFMDMAELVSTKSKDPSTKCGAVVVSPENVVLSTGFNGFPRGVEEEQKITTIGTPEPKYKAVGEQYFYTPKQMVMQDAIHVASGVKVSMSAAMYNYQKTPIWVTKSEKTVLNDRWDKRPEKYWWVEHAERNAIYAAAKCGHPLEDSTMYVNQSIICCDCAKGIIQTGIKTVVTSSKPWPGHKDSTFVKQVEITNTMFSEAGVTVR